MSGTLDDVPGIRVGHRSLGDTGCTVILPETPAICAVDVRGGGPGTRETDLLEPHNTVQHIHAITLSGGSAYGLAAADGVMTLLEKSGIGFPVLGESVTGPIVPIVPAAVIFDLLVGDADNRPTATDGYQAAQAALTREPSKSNGNIGAGCGATAGKLRGGFGQASTHVGDWVVAAAIVANPVGEIVDVETGALWARPDIRINLAKYRALASHTGQLNTTIGVIATNAPITKSQAKRLAIAGHDGIAWAIRPAHSPLDGDTLFALTTAQEPANVDTDTMRHLSHAAATVVSEAIIAAVMNAEPGYGLTTLNELFDDTTKVHP
ncbi:L-aminopeptidase/D-esterase [Corynebacterium mustelae]|uniref:L-aminopeptidase/D-esterase n=1 Tax=Corynebacterium mustelae TaxID=571915 RepID=A0A0G3H4Q6_9CORY|nr:P1 family peptidase [Corynebacterium mustelae]AKK06808.1 L-aminopeptidase/D-esterase [Corynebacterium mustelae]